MPRTVAVRPVGPQGDVLVDSGGRVWPPYDLTHLTRQHAAWSRLSATRDVRHFQRRSFERHLPENEQPQILNAMGVALWDSIICMNAPDWPKATHPRLRLHLYRTLHASPFVERL